MALKNVIIVGAGGHLGPSILSAFRGDARFNVSILSRQSSKSTFPEDVEVHRVGDEYPDDEVLAAFNGQDVVISTIATANVKQQKHLIDLAIKAGVKRFVPSEFGSDTRNEKALTILPQYFGGKIATVDYLMEKEKEGLTWSAFVTGPFFELYVSSHSSTFEISIYSSLAPIFLHMYIFSSLDKWKRSTTTLSPQLT